MMTDSSDYPGKDDLPPISQAGSDHADSTGESLHHSMIQIEGYALDEQIGAGGMGTVWRATQHATGRLVALKLMNTAHLGSEKARRRFEREVELAASLEHPGIARVYDSGIRSDVYFYSMELIEGTPIDEYVRERELQVDQILDLFSQVCSAMTYAHQQGVIHRDLKPPNILVRPDGAPVILDFGLAKAIGSDLAPHTLTLEGDIAGTLSYMSPEQAAGHVGQVDVRSEVYSLGVLLFHLLTGKFPHDQTGTRFEVQKRIVEREVDTRHAIKAGLNRELSAVLTKALMRAPEQRYQSVAELHADIRSYRHHLPLRARPLTLGYFLNRWVIRRRRSLFWTGTAVILIALIGVAASTRIRQAIHTSSMITYQKQIREAKEKWDRGNMEGARALLDSCPAELRHWEWHYLSEHLDRSSWTMPLEIKRHAAIGWNSRSKRFVLVDPSGNILSLDPRTGQPRPIGSPRPAPAFEALAFRRDGQCVALARGNQIMRVDCNTGEKQSALQTDLGLIRGLAWSPQGNRLFAVDDDGQARVYEEKQEIARFALGFRPYNFHSIYFYHANKILWPMGGGRDSPDAHASGGIEVQTTPVGRVRGSCWSEKHNGPLIGHEGGTITAISNGHPNERKRYSVPSHQILAIASDQTVIAVADDARVIHLLDVANGRTIVSLTGHSHPIQKLAFSPDGKWLISLAEFGEVKTWNMTTLMCADRFQADLPGPLLSGLALSADGRTAALGYQNGEARFLDIHQMTTIAECWKPADSSLVSLCYAPTAGYLHIAALDGSVTTYRAADGRIEGRYELANDQPVSLSVSPNGRWLAVGSMNQLMLFDRVAGRDPRKIPGQRVAAWSHDNALLATAVMQSDQTHLVVYNTSDWTKKIAQPLKTPEPGWMAFNPIRPQLACLDTRGRLWLWNLNTEPIVIPLFRDRGCVKGAFTPDGERLAVLGEKLKLLDAHNGAELISIECGNAHPLNNLCFDRSGQNLYLQFNSHLVRLSAVPPAKP